MDVKIQLWLQLTLNQPHLKAGSKDSTLWLWSWRGKWACPSYKNPSCAGMGTSPPQSRLCAKASAFSPKKENYQAQLHWILQSMQKDFYNLVVAEKKSEKWKKEKWPLREITIQKNPGSDVTQLKQPLLRSGGDFGRAVPPCKPTKGRFSPRFLSGHPELRMSNSSVNSVPIIHPVPESEKMPSATYTETEQHVSKAKSMAEKTQLYGDWEMLLPPPPSPLNPLTKPNASQTFL